MIMLNFFTRNIRNNFLLANTGSRHVRHTSKFVSNSSRRIKSWAGWHTAFGLT